MTAVAWPCVVATPVGGRAWRRTRSLTRSWSRHGRRLARGRDREGGRGDADAANDFGLELRSLVAPSTA
jgi:hypothetical protein